MTTLYAETNLLLELAYRQEQADYCEQFLDAAEAGQLKLVVPMLALFEPLYKWRGDQDRHSKRAEEWQNLARQLDRRKDEVSAELHATLAQAAQHARKLVEIERRALANVIDRIARCARVIPLLPQDFAAAYEHEQMGLMPADALILVAILRDAREHSEAHERSNGLFFFTRDSNFTRNAVVHNRLKEAGIEPLSSAEHLVKKLRSRGAMLAEPRLARGE